MKGYVTQYLAAYFTVRVSKAERGQRRSPKKKPAAPAVSKHAPIPVLSWPHVA